MTLIGYRSSNHPQQVAKRDANDDVDDRGTTATLFDPLNHRFGGFTLDVAAAAHNTKCERYFTREDDGLAQSWAGERVWCNPPYSSIASWVEKAWTEQGQAKRIVMLLPANRTEQAWWQDMVEPFRDLPESPLRVEFLRGRLRFDRPSAVIGPKGDRPPFGCCLLIWESGAYGTSFTNSDVRSRGSVAERLVPSATGDQDLPSGGRSSSPVPPGNGTGAATGGA